MLLSRRANTKRVKVTLADGSDPIDVTVRALRATEMIWAQSPLVEGTDAEATMVFVRMVQLGLLSVDNVNDPDTGKPFELKFTTIKIGERGVQILSIDTIDALMPYVTPIAYEIAALNKLSYEEKETIPFIGNSSTPKVTSAAQAVEEPTGSDTNAPEGA